MQPWTWWTSVPSFIKIVQAVKKLNSISRARLNFRRRPILCQLCLETLCNRATSAVHLTVKCTAEVARLHKVSKQSWHKIGRLWKFNRAREIEFNFLTAWTIFMKLGTQTNFSFKFFFMKFSQKMPLNIFYTMGKKKLKWPKTQIKGGPALKERLIFVTLCCLGNLPKKFLVLLKTANFRKWTKRVGGHHPSSETVAQYERVLALFTPRAKMDSETVESCRGTPMPHSGCLRLKMQKIHQVKVVWLNLLKAREIIKGHWIRLRPNRTRTVQMLKKKVMATPSRTISSAETMSWWRFTRDS